MDTTHIDADTTEDIYEALYVCWENYCEQREEVHPVLYVTRVLADSSRELSDVADYACVPSEAVLSVAREWAESVAA